MKTDSTYTYRLVFSGFKAAWPICVGYFPLGLALGVVAQNAGLSVVEIGFMSLLVFAGSAQFIAVSMLQGGAAIPAIVATTFVVNLRHVLMSSSLAVHLRGMGRRFLAFFAYGVTDESFAVNLNRFRGGAWHPTEALVVNQLSNATWIVSTVLGGYGGQYIGQKSFGIDYALIAMFIGLIVFQIRGGIYVVTAVAAGGLAVLLGKIIPGNAYVVLASLGAATLGFAMQRAVKRKGGRGPAT